MSRCAQAGKSRQIDQRYRSRNIPMTVIDLDAEMVAHPRYDPADPDSVYRLEEAWAFANARVEANFQASLTNRSYARVIVDGTGTNIERQVRRMKEVRAAGWFVKVLYVRVPVKTAIDRAMLRTRRGGRNPMLQALRLAHSHPPAGTPARPHV